MENPFDALQQQLDRIENMLVQILKRETSPPASTVEKPLSIEQAAQYLGLSITSIYHNKRIPRHKNGKRLRFLESELLDYIRNGPKETAISEDILIRRPRRNRRKL